MPVGLAEVAEGQGSGLSWMGPASTFDPITYSKDLIAIKQRKVAADTKKKDATLKLLDVTPLDQYNNDLVGTRDFYLDSQKYIADLAKQKGEWDITVKTEAQRVVTEGAFMQQQKNHQFEAGKSFYDVLEKDGGKTLSYGDMNEKYKMWASPEQYLDSDQFKPYQDGYDEIVTRVNKDPYYAANQKAAIQKIRLEFRDQYQGDMLTTILKPESLIKNWVSIKDFLVNTIKTVTEKGGVVKTDERSTLDGQDVKLSDGTIQHIPGTKETAGINYDTADDISRSAKQLFETKTQDIKDKYTSADPAREWYIDQMTLGGKDITTSQTNVKGKKSWGAGGHSWTTDWDFVEYAGINTLDRATKIDQASGISGWHINKDDKELTLSNATIIEYYELANNTQTVVPAGSTKMKFSGVSVYLAAVFSEGLTFEQLKDKLGEIDNDKGGTAWDDFVSIFGRDYAAAESSGSLKGIQLTNKEVKFLQTHIPGFVTNGKFASGALEYITLDADGKEVKTNIESAIVPLDDVLSKQIEGITGVSFNLALDKFKKKYKEKKAATQTPKTTTTQLTPNKKLKFDSFDGTNYWLGADLVVD